MNFEALLQDVDDFKLSSGLLKPKHRLDNDRGSEKKWEEPSEGVKLRKGPPTLVQKWAAKLCNKTCEACAHSDSSPDPICEAKPWLWAYYRWCEILKEGQLIIVLVNEGLNSIMLLPVEKGFIAVDKGFIALDKGFIAVDKGFLYSRQR